MDTFSGFDLDELERELEEYEDAEEEFDTFNLTDYERNQKPFFREDEDVAIGETVPIGEEKKKSASEIKFGKLITEEDVMKNASILYPEKKLYRSLLLEVFTPERCFELEKLSRTFSITNNEKVSLIQDKLKSWKVEYASLGPGTNRYAIMIDGYVIKIALDEDGKIDNKREFMYSLPLQPYVIKCYETLGDGLMAVFEYVEIFTIDDYWKNQDKMREILADIASSFMIGDVGVSSNNYVNWGFRDDGSLVILDFAYIYSVAFKKFTCNCSMHSILHYDKDFNNLICPICGKKYDFRTIRKKISRDDQDKEIGDIMQKGYILSDVEQEKKFNPKFVQGAYDKVFKKLIKMKKKQNERISRSKKSSEDYEPMSLEDILTEIKTSNIEMEE